MIAHRIEQPLQTALARIDVKELGAHAHPPETSSTRPTRAGPSCGAASAAASHSAGDRPQATGARAPYEAIDAVPERTSPERVTTSTATRRGTWPPSTQRLSAHTASHRTTWREPRQHPDRPRTRPCATLRRTRAGVGTSSPRSPRRTRSPSIEPPRDDRAGTVGIVKSADRADPGRAQPLANPRSGTGQILELEARVHAGQVGAAPHDRGRGLVRLGSRLRQPRARCHRDRDRYALGERRGDRRFHAGDQDARIIAGTEARRELVDRVDRGHREHALDRGNHPTVDVNVALDPLGTHDEPRAERPSIADPIARFERLHASRLC